MNASWATASGVRPPPACGPHAALVTTLRVLLLSLATLLLPGCAGPCAAVGEGDHFCTLDGFAGRPYELHIPAGDGPFPVVFLLHGGGGKAQSTNEITCPEGDADDPACFEAVAADLGFVVVQPNGTAKLLSSFRTWNAGGGGAIEGSDETWRCSSGIACEEGIDDVAYIDAVLADVGRNVDVAEVFSTGLSNGAAMSHRLACERASVFSAIGAVGGANQFATTEVCAPDQPVAVLQIHGTEDPCWPYDGGNGSCFNEEGLLLDVLSSTTAWAELNDCGDSTPTSLADPMDDGATSTQTTWADCTAPVSLVTVQGGGHTWPGGELYLREEKIGPVTLDFSASEMILTFFRDQIGG